MAVRRLVIATLCPCSQGSIPAARDTEWFWHAVDGPLSGMLGFCVTGTRDVSILKWEECGDPGGVVVVVIMGRIGQDQFFLVPPASVSCT